MIAEDERLRPTRIFIADLIDREGPRCVWTQMLQRSPGILQDKKQGATVYSSLACSCIADFMTGLESVSYAKHRNDQKAYAAVMGGKTPA
jgi:hypothetical protein